LPGSVSSVMSTIHMKPGSASSVRSAHLRRNALNALKESSIGLRSGE